MKKTKQDDYISTLPEEKRLVLLVQIYKIIQDVAKLQASILDKTDHKDIPDYNLRHEYFETIVQSFWLDAEYVLSLGQGKYQVYAVYPTRAMMEKALKLIWFSNQTQEKQDTIAKKDLLRQCRVLYQVEKEDIYPELYKEINSDGELPDSENVRMSDLKSYPPCEQLCLNSKLEDADTLYKSYRYLSARPHADFLWTFAAHKMEGESDKEYRRALMIATRFLIEVTKIVDFQIGNKTKDEIAKALKMMDDLRLGKTPTIKKYTKLYCTFHLIVHKIVSTILLCLSGKPGRKKDSAKRS